MSLLVNPNSVQDERDRLLKVVSGTFKLLNAALGYVLNCKKTETSNALRTLRPLASVGREGVFD